MTTKRLTLDDAEYLIQCNQASMQLDAQIDLIRQLQKAHQAGAARVLCLLAGPGDWKISRDEGGYLLTQASPGTTKEEGPDAPKI